MGYDPFVTTARTAVDAVVEARGRGFVGRVVIREAGELVGERTLSTPAGECQELVESMAVAVSIVLDPFGTTVPEAQPVADPVTSEPDPAEDPPDPVAGPDPDEAPLRTRVWAGDPNHVAFPFPEDSEPDVEREATSARVTIHTALFVGIGTAPRATLGPILGAGVRFKHLSLLVDGRLDSMLGLSTNERGDDIGATIFTVGPTLCGHFGIVMGCAGAQFGAFQGRAPSVLTPQTVSTFVAFADFSGGVSIPLTPILDFRALVELRIPMVRTTLSIEGMSVWDAPAAAGTLRIGLAITI